MADDTNVVADSNSNNVGTVVVDVDVIQFPGSTQEFIASKNTVLLATESVAPQSNEEEEEQQQQQQPDNKLRPQSSFSSRARIKDQALVTFLRTLSASVPDGCEVPFTTRLREPPSSPQATTTTTTDDELLFAIVSNPRLSRSLIVVARFSIDFDASHKNIVFACPILSTAKIEFRGKGVFGLSMGDSSSRFYFSSMSLHAMWTAVVALERHRNAAKRANAYEAKDELSWVSQLFVPLSTPPPTANRITDSSSSPTAVEEETGDVGEGGRVVFIGGGGGAASGLRTPPPPSTENSMVYYWLAPNEKSTFALHALDTLLISPTSKDRYTKPSVTEVKECIQNFVCSAPDPEQIETDHVLTHLRTVFGAPIVGKQGYSMAFLDTVLFETFGQMVPPSNIITRLWLGSQYNAANKLELLRLGVSHVLNVTTQVDRFFPDCFVYSQIHVLDVPSASLLPFLERACDFIQDAIENGTGIFVHCQEGVSRSASVVIAYIMRSQKLTFKDAYTLVKTQRKVVNPNPGFRSQLLEWEKVVL